MIGRAESYVLCEGYHDRAFWAGILSHLTCADLSLKPTGGRKRPFDPFGTELGAGQYAFKSASERFIRVVPAGGKKEIPKLVRIRLEESKTKPLDRLVVNVDSDTHADGSQAVDLGLTRESLLTIVRDFDSNARATVEGDIDLQSGGTKISFVQWLAPEPPTIGIPNQHTLERIICASILGVYPVRGPEVQQWLNSRTAGPNAGPKEFAWSYLAGWHADSGSYEGFCASLWRDSQVAEQLKLHLTAAGVWRVATALSS